MDAINIPLWYHKDDEITPELAHKFQQYLKRYQMVVANNWGNVCNCGYFRPHTKRGDLSCEHDVCQRWECNNKRQPPSGFCSSRCEKEYNRYWSGGGPEWSVQRHPSGERPSDFSGGITGYLS